MKRGDFVELAAYPGERIGGMIVLASENATSLLVMFDGIFHGYVSSIPLLRDPEDEPGIYRDLVSNTVIAVRIIDREKYQ